MGILYELRSFRSPANIRWTLNRRLLLLFALLLLLVDRASAKLEFTNNIEDWGNIYAGVEFTIFFTGFTDNATVYMDIWEAPPSEDKYHRRMGTFEPPYPPAETIGAAYTLGGDWADLRYQFSLWETSETDPDNIGCWSPIFHVQTKDESPTRTTESITSTSTPTSGSSSISTSTIISSPTSTDVHTTVIETPPSSTAPTSIPSQAPAGGTGNDGPRKFTTGELAGICIGAIIGGCLFLGLIGDFLYRCCGALRRRFRENDSNAVEDGVPDGFLPPTGIVGGANGAGYNEPLGSSETHEPGIAAIGTEKPTGAPINELDNTKPTFTANELETNNPQPNELEDNIVGCAELETINPSNEPRELDSNPPVTRSPTLRELEANTFNTYRASGDIPHAETGTGIVSPLSSGSVRSDSGFQYPSVPFASPMDIGYGYSYGYDGAGTYQSQSQTWPTGTGTGSPAPDSSQQQGQPHAGHGFGPASSYGQ